MNRTECTTKLAVSDVFADALMDQGASGELLVERAGAGLRANSLHPTSLRWWLRQHGQPDPVDFTALDLITAGPVLDVGCATGRHVAALGRAGVPAEGIDISPAAVALAQLYGCNVRLADIWTFGTPRRYRWLLALGNNLGLAGRLADLPRFLDRLAGLLLPGGEVLLSSVDPGQFDGLAPSGRDSGELRLRHHYAGQRGPWFDWLYVGPETLAMYASEAGFACRVVERFGEVYVAVLRLAAATA